MKELLIADFRLRIAEEVRFTAVTPEFPAGNRQSTIGNQGALIAHHRGVS